MVEDYLIPSSPTPDSPILTITPLLLTHHFISYINTSQHISASIQAQLCPQLHPEPLYTLPYLPGSIPPQQTPPKTNPISIMADSVSKAYAEIKWYCVSSPSFPPEQVPGSNSS